MGINQVIEIVEKTDGILKVRATDEKLSPMINDMISGIAYEINFNYKYGGLFGNVEAEFLEDEQLCVLMGDKKAIKAAQVLLEMYIHTGIRLGEIDESD